MDSRISKPADHLDAMRCLRAEDLCEIERYRKEKGVAQFIHDKVLDVFRFPEDNRFAFCDEFADWDLLQERGYFVV